MNRPDRILTALMRFNAILLLLAVVPIGFPTAWMAEMHQRFALGSFPQDRLTEYLTRSAAACYALHGAMIWLLATDVRRYRPLIPPVYILHLLFALTILGIDLYAGMPGWWIISEVGTISTVAIILLGVSRWAAGHDPVELPKF